MTRAALELNDAGLLVVHDSAPGSPRGAASPGYALLDGERILAGAEAAEAARLRPRLAHSRFWSELSTRPLGRPFPRGLSPADLAHAHLGAVWGAAGGGAEELLLAVPGSFAGGQLGLLLGIARAAGLPVVGLVDAAVAAASTQPAGSRRLLHLDLELHRAVLTELRVGAEVLRARVRAETGTGLAPILDGLAKRTARLFVRETRFDPLHAAGTESRLYRELPAWLARLGEGETVVVSLESGGLAHALELDWARLAEACETAFATLARLVAASAEGEDPPGLLLTSRVAGLPGLRRVLEDAAGGEARVLPEAAAARGALRSAAEIRSPGEELPFVTRLPLRPSVTLRPPSPAPRRERGAPPTHLLVGPVAHPITREPLVAGAEARTGEHGLSLPGASGRPGDGGCAFYREGESVVAESRGGDVRLNGEPLEGRALVAAGDRLRLGNPGVEIRLIRVADGHGPA